MSAVVDVLAVMRRDASDAWNARYNDSPADAQAHADHCLQESELARAAIANLIAERDALHWAIVAYPKRNTHQLQAQRVCDGVIALAVARVGGAK